jgi:hypothetical protein
VVLFDKWSLAGKGEATGDDGCGGASVSAMPGQDDGHVAVSPSL